MIVAFPGYLHLYFWSTEKHTGRHKSCLPAKYGGKKYQAYLIPLIQKLYSYVNNCKNNHHHERDVCSLVDTAKDSVFI